MTTVTLETVIQRYSRPAVFFHWIMAILIFSDLAIGLLFDDMSKQTHDSIMPFHQTIGVLVLVFLVLRLTWRFIHPHPPLHFQMPRQQYIIAKSVEGIIYLAMLIIPVTGMLMPFSRLRPVNMILFTIPSPFANDNPDFGKLAHGIHTYMAYILIAMLVLHIGAALAHQFVWKHRLLERMR